MSGQGISSSDFSALQTAKEADISSYIYLPDTPPPTIDTGVLPSNLQTKVSECNGNDNCKLIAYDFVTDIGKKASNSPYLIQLEATDRDPDKSDFSVLAKIGTNPVTSLGIPTDNLDTQYDPNHLLLTPPIVSGPIGYSYREGTAISGTSTSTVTSTSADACADTCTSTNNCRGFNFDENATSCALFSLVDTEAVIGAQVGGSSNTIDALTLNLKNAVTGLAANQTIDGLDDYINGTITIKSVASSMQIQIGFSTQIVRAIPENTRFRIKAPTTVSALQSYVYEKEHIDYIGVNGTETYGYNAAFNISGIPGLPTQTNGAISSSGTTVLTSLVVPVNMSGINALLSTGSLPIVRGAQGCTSGVISTNDVQTTVCGCSQVSVDDPLCKIPMTVKSYTSTNITFGLPTNSLLQYGSSSGSPLNLTAIEFTATLAAGNEPVPSDRIIGWSGAITQVSGPAIPVRVKSFTASTITFSFPAQSYGTINAQAITLSDTKGIGCQDIKACNASIQRLLDDSTVSSFSTKDLVACSGCNERAYKKQSTGASFGSKLREYLWFENAGVFACTASAPPGTTLNAKCEPVCATPANGDSAVYDSVSLTCRVTCRTGFYWNGTACVSCPSVTLPTNITIQAAAMCQATCVHASGTTPQNMTLSSVSGTDISAIPNYTQACAVSCSQGLPNFQNTRCCPAVTNTPTGTTITSYTDDCVTPTCGKTDGTGDFIDTVTGASGPTCTYTCLTPATNNQTSVSVNNSDTNQTGIVLPVQDSTFTTITTPLTGIPYLTTATKIQTNIGSYYFFPPGSQAAIYTGSGTPTLYTLTTTSVAFPFKIKIESIQFWKSGSVTSVGISLKKNEGGTEVLNQTQTLSASPSTFTNTTQVYGKYLTLTFTGIGQVAYKITATVQKICTAVCSPPAASASLGRAVLETNVIPENSRTCVMLCNQGYSPTGTGCSSCPPANLDPGTKLVSFDATCAGTCSVFDPTAANNANTLGGANATSTGFSLSTSGTCSIASCPSGRTKYTASTGTTLNNSGCCPIPTIVDTAGTDLTGTGITWSYPSGQTSTSESTARCAVTCSLPNPNTYGMTVSSSSPTTNTRSCVRGACPALTSPTGFTISRLSTCEPVCGLSTPDANSGTTTTYNASTTTVSCTKTCKSGYTKDSATSICCPTYTGGVNITITYGTASCNANPCSVSDNTSGYASVTQNTTNRTCSISCKTRGTDQTGTTGSYSSDSKCTFSCSTTSPNATGNPATDANGNPYCVFGCSTGYYKSLGAFTCCENITSATGTTPTKNNDATCNFTCAISDTTTYPTSSHQASVSGRTCVLACQPGYIQYPNSGSQLCCQPGYFPYNGVCTVVVDQNIIRDTVAPYSVEPLNWCYDVKGITTTEAWWTVIADNTPLAPSRPATTNSQAGCPSGQFGNGGLYNQTKHVRCSPGYSIDLDLVTGNFGNDKCYLNSFLQWTKTYRSGFTCPATATVVCNGTSLQATSRKFHGYCIALNTSCTSATLSCTGTYNRYNLPDSEPFGICASL